MTAKELLKELHKDGWEDINQRGSHLYLEHPTKPGKLQFQYNPETSREEH